MDKGTCEILLRGEVGFMLAFLKQEWKSFAVLLSRPMVHCIKMCLGGCRGIRRWWQADSISHHEINVKLCFSEPFAL